MPKLFGGITIPGQPDLLNIAKLDRLPIPMIRKMERVGFAIDLPRLADLGSQIRSEMADLQRDISSYIPIDSLAAFCAASDAVEELEGSASINANSSEQIRLLLFQHLNIGRARKLKSTGSGLVSTGKKNLEQCRSDHPVVPLVLKYRERSKLISSFVNSLPKLARLHPRGADCPLCGLYHAAPTHRLHTELPTTRAETGRLASRKPNLMQIPVRTHLGQAIRACFIASLGKRLVSVDFSQIEIRDLAHLANARSMIRVYEAGGDIHDNTARAIFNLPSDVKPDKYNHRLPAKRCNFSIQNGVSPKGVHFMLVMDYGASDIPVPSWLTVDWCEWFIAEWHKTYPEAQEYFDLQHYRARRYGYVWCPFGRVRRIPEVYSCHRWIIEEGLRKTQNLPITASSAAQTKLVMAELDEEFDMLRASGVDLWPLLAIHDQIIAEVEEDAAPAVLDLMVDRFARVMQDRETGERRWRLDIGSDGEILSRWQKE